MHDDKRRRREKITGKVLTLDRSSEDTLPYLFFLLGIAEPTSPLQQMDPQIRRQRTFAIKRLLLRESLNQPLLLIFEDLRWLMPRPGRFCSLSVTVSPRRASCCWVTTDPVSASLGQRRPHGWRQSLGREQAERDAAAYWVNP
jgi:hypothetical protein